MVNNYWGFAGKVCVWILFGLILWDLVILTNQVSELQNVIVEQDIVPVCTMYAYK